MEFADPMSKFAAAWTRVHDTAPAGYESDAATLATSDAHGRPSARIVLVRGLDTHGFTFFTNYGSRKAHELDANPRAALCFYWFWLEQQVRVEGDVQKAAVEVSDSYFAGRPRGSQVSAWASQQSEPLDAREALEERYHEIDDRYGDRAVPRPPFWGGYLLVPDRIEFWHAGAYRLHDRHLYTRSGDSWQVQRLSP